MCGPTTPLVDGRPSGVFGWQPPAELVTGLSDLLDGAGGSSHAIGGAG
jgi:exodeoxyribonuclease V beta subunit